MQIESLPRTDPRYPSLLKHIYLSPEVLYYAGDLSLLEAPCLAIVGTRRCTQRGEATAFRFAEALAREGLVIVSGLAFGIDAAAHRGALNAPGKTIAVLAQPLDELRPASHRHLAQEILEKGGLLLSEYAQKEKTFKTDYLRRNRLIAGLCRATLVVEAGHPSGALNTAKHAVEEGRDVYCIPGRLEDEVSLGCLDLIKEGAHLVTCPEDFSLAFDLKFERTRALGNLKLNRFESELCDLLKKGPLPLSELSLKYEKTLPELYDALSRLEFCGVLRQSAARHYSLA